MANWSNGSKSVGATELARIAGKSRTWAKNLLKEWLLEQEAGGPQRVFVFGKKRAVRTTLAIIQRELLVNVRDPLISKKLEEHDRDLDTLARRIDKLTTELHALRSARRAS